jgi:hypothetical protein
MPLTPNHTLFVRYHNADVPEIDAAKWRFTVQIQGARVYGNASGSPMHASPSSAQARWLGR